MSGDAEVVGPRYSYAKGSAARAPFLFSQRVGSTADLSASSQDNVLPVGAATTPLNPPQVRTLVEPIVAAMRQTTFYDIMGSSTLVVVLDVNSTVAVCVAAAQESKASSFLIWDPFCKETGGGRFIAILTLTNFIQILLHCHESPDQVPQLSNMSLREMISMPFAKVRRPSEVVHASPDISLYDMLGLMITNSVNHVPVLIDSSTSSSSSASSSPPSSSPTSLIGVAFLPQLLSQVVRIINNPAVAVSPTTVAAAAVSVPFSTLFEVPIGLLTGLGDKLNSKDVDGAASWLRAEETVYQALRRLVDYNVQALPIINEHGVIIDTFSRSDVIGLEDLGVYNLNQSVRAALARVRHQSISVCQMDDTVGDVVAHFVATGVRTLFVVQKDEFMGQLQVGDLLRFLYFASTG